MVAIFGFFIMANANILFPSTLGKWEIQTWGVSNLNFFHMTHIYEMVAIFKNLMADADIPLAKC